MDPVFPAFSLTLGDLVVDETALDVGGETLVVEYGIRSNDPTERVAAAGTLTCALDNSEQNAGAQLGFYSLFNALRSADFDFNIPVRFSLSCPDVNSDQEYPKFVGKLDQAPATAGRRGDRLTRISAVDILDDYGKIDEPEISVQINKRADQLLTTLLDGVATQPDARDIETGSDVYSVAFDGGTGQKLKVRERVQQICLSEAGYAYVLAGTFIFENRQHRVRNPDVLFTFDNDMFELPVPASRGDLYSKVQVRVYPTNDFSTASVVVLYSLQTTHVSIRPGETNDSLFGPYRDPVNNDQIGGDTSSMTNPEASTDYTMNSAEDGSGTDLTTQFTVTTVRTGVGVRFSITNNGVVPAFITKLQQRGKPIYRYEALIERELSTTYGERILTFTMPFQNNLNVGRDAADYLANVHGMRVGRPPYVRFLANDSAAFMEAALEREPGDRIALSEEVTGLAYAEFTINGCRLELEPGLLLWCTWYLEPATSDRFWLIGTAGASEIGLTTVPGF